MESFLMMQNPSHKIPFFNISHVSRINLNLSIKDLKGKKIFYLIIQLLSSDITKSNIRDLDFSNSNNTGNNTGVINDSQPQALSNRNIRSNKSLFNAEKFDDIYGDLFEQSLNEDGSKIESVINKFLILDFV